MGLAKNDFIECRERGYGHSSSVVCHECIGNKIIKNFIRTNGTLQECTYCKNRRKSLDLERIMPLIMGGVYFKYGLAVEELPYEKGYVGNTYDTSEIIVEDLADDIDAQNDKIIEDIVGIMDDEVWCDANPFSDKREDTDYYDWQSFCKLVKEKIRYVFYRAEAENINKDPAQILDTIAEYADKLKLIRKIDRNASLYRCRTSEKEAWFSEVADLAPPPTEYASAGRMNAAGINVFYLTLDSKTALFETNEQGKDYATVACFKVKESITVLDLTKIKKKLPSVFDAENRDNRSAILFLERFSHSISQKATSKNTDYVPTQIVTEYFRYVAKNHGSKYDGIMYESAQNPNGICLALFLSREDVLAKKYGIHIVPKLTAYYQKQYQSVDNPGTQKAKAMMFIESQSKKKLSEIEEATVKIGERYVEELVNGKNLTKV